MNEPLKPKPYPNYRPSGVKWFDRLPTHWEVRRLRNVADLRVSSVDKHKREDEEHVRLCNYVDVYNNDRITATMNFMHATAAPDEIERFRLERGDVLITKDSETWDDIGIPALVTDSAPDLISGYHLALLRPRSEHAIGGYLFRALESKGISRQFHIQARGVTRFGLTHVGIKSVWLPVPPLSEQVCIVRFLDRIDRRIRRYIRAKQKLMTLLEEQKQAIIHQAVTGKIDVRTGRPFPKYKSSGVECIGDIPKHWSVRRFKSLVKRIDQGISPQAERHLADGGAWGVLKAGCVNEGVFRQHEHKRLPWGFEFDAALVVSPGDVLVARASGSPHFVGSTGRVPALQYNLILSDKTFRPVFSVDLDAGFMVLAMNGSYFREQVERAISGAEGLANNLPLSALRAFHFAIPSVDEQRMIVGYVGTFSESLSKSIEQARRMISLLREYRSRLISDVVTGKLNVREPKATLQRWRSIGDPLHRNAGSCA